MKHNVLYKQTNNTVHKTTYLKVIPLYSANASGGIPPGSFTSKDQLVITQLVTAYLLHRTAYLHQPLLHGCFIEPRVNINDRACRVD